MRADQFDSYPGLDLDKLRKEVRAHLSERSVSGTTEVAAFAASLPSMAPILQSDTIRQAVKLYFGGAESLVGGYLLSHLGDTVVPDHYPSGRYHHDRCGRMLKLFVYLDDVGAEGHPTIIARGTANFTWFGMQTDDSTRFADDLVERTFGDRLVKSKRSRARLQLGGAVCGEDARL